MTPYGVGGYREADKTSGGRPGPRLIKQVDFLIWTTILDKSILKLYYMDHGLELIIPSLEILEIEVCNII